MLDLIGVNDEADAGFGRVSPEFIDKGKDIDDLLANLGDVDNAFGIDKQGNKALIDEANGPDEETKFAGMDMN